MTKLRKLLRRTTDDIALHLTMLNLKIATINAQAVPNRNTAILANFDKILEESATNIVAQLTNTVESSMITLEESIQSNIDRRLNESFSALSCQLDQHHRNLESRIRNLGREVPTSHAILPQNANYLGLQRRKCECPCHSFHQPKSLKASTGKWELAWLQRVLGSLRLSYRTTGPSPDDLHREHCRLRTRANSNRPQHQDQRNILVQWKLPPWLAQAIISMYFSQRDRPELLIRVHRIISTESASYSQSIIGRVHANDLEGVKNLVTSCPSVIHDVDPTGNSALLFAAGFRQVSTVRFLLQAGADPFQESSGQNTPVRYALMLSIRSPKAETNSPERQIASMMPLSTLLDEEEYTDLHRIIISVLPLDLQTALMGPLFRNQVNSKTTTGVTPLHLAARDCPTGRETKLLLAAGADPDAVAGDGTAPLHNACRGGNHEAVEALLKAGASPELGTKTHYLRETLLHALAQAQESDSVAKIMDVLLMHASEHGYGINLNAVDKLGITPLSIAAEFNHVTVLRCLIEKGANLDTVDHDGDTPLHNATTHRSHGAVKLLLGIGTESQVSGVGERYSAVNEARGWGILHYIADFGDVEMMRVFEEVKMRDLPDPETFKDLQGRTAGEIFEARVGNLSSAGGDGDGDGEIEGLVKVWRDLLATVNRGSSEDKGGDCEDEEGGDKRNDCQSSDDEFFDVLEY